MASDIRRHHAALERSVDAYPLDVYGSARETEVHAIRRFANVLAVLAALLWLPQVVLGVGNWRLSAALACPLVLGILAAAGRRAGVSMAPRHTLLHPAYTGAAGGTVLIGVGLHTTIGVLLAAAAVAVLLKPPTPPAPAMILATAAIGPWLTEAVADVPGKGTMIVGLLVVGMVALVWARSGNVETLVIALCVATTAYVAAAIALHLLGLNATYSEGYLAQARTSFGPFDLRWRLPLSVSWVTVPTVSTLGSVLCVWAFRIDRREIGRGATPLKALCVAGFVMHFVAVVGANGRTQLLATVVGAALASGLVPKSVRTALALSCSALWLAPVWWNAIAGGRGSLVATILREYVPSRGGSDRTVTLQGRTHVWEVCFDFFNGGSLAQHAYGWGPDGHITSGAAAQYSGFLGGGYRVGYYPPHDAFLEVLLSGGLTLALIFLAGVVWMFVMQVAIYRHGPPLTAAGIAGLSVALAAVAFPEIAVLVSNASPAAVVGPMVVMITLAAYAQSVASRKSRAVHPPHGCSREFNSSCGS